MAELEYIADLPSSKLVDIEEPGGKSTELGGGLLSLQSQGCLCDVRLVAGDGAVVRAHKVVLAATSNYFRARLAGPWSESADSSTVSVPHISGRTLELCVKVCRVQKIYNTQGQYSTSASRLNGRIAGALYE